MDDFQHRLMVEALIACPSSLDDSTIDKYLDVAIRELVIEHYVLKDWMTPLVQLTRVTFPGHPFIRTVEIAEELKNNGFINLD